MSISLLFDFVGTLSLGKYFRIELPKEDVELIRSGIYQLM